MFPDEFNCCVCLEKFQTPKKLPCQHDVCVKCLEMLLGNDVELKCPICRQLVPHRSAKSFPTDSVLEEKIQDYESLLTIDSLQEDIGLDSLFEIVPTPETVVARVNENVQLSAPLAQLFEDLGFCGSGPVPEGSTFPVPEPIPTGKDRPESSNNMSDVIKVVDMIHKDNIPAVPISDPNSQNKPEIETASINNQAVSLPVLILRQNTNNPVAPPQKIDLGQVRDEILKDLGCLDLTEEELKFILDGSLMEKENLINLNAALEMSRLDMPSTSGSGSRGNPLLNDLAAELDLTQEERDFIEKSSSIEKENIKNLNLALELSKKDMAVNLNHTEENPLLSDLIDLNLTQEESDFLSNEFVIEKENIENLNRALEMSLQMVSEKSDNCDIEEIIKGIQFYEDQISIYQDIMNQQKEINTITDTNTNSRVDDEEGACGGVPLLN